MKKPSKKVSENKIQFYPRVSIDIYQRIQALKEEGVPDSVWVRDAIIEKVLRDEVKESVVKNIKENKGCLAGVDE